MELYGHRWHVELDLRNIKTTLGVEVLRCLTPQMVAKEFWVNWLAYNLIRLLMAQAALEAGLHPRELSFKHTVQIWMQWLSLRRARGHDWHRDTLLRLIAQIRIGQRPGRMEPRARKRRLKPYSWLKVPRPRPSAECLSKCHCRFNRRFDLAAMIERLACVALRTPLMPHRLLSTAEVWG